MAEKPGGLRTKAIKNRVYGNTNDKPSDLQIVAMCLEEIGNFLERARVPDSLRKQVGLAIVAEAREKEDGERLSWEEPADEAADEYEIDP